MALILAALAVAYTRPQHLVARKKTSTGQNAVERYHNNVYGRVGDVLGNVTVVQSYAACLRNAGHAQHHAASCWRRSIPC